jgi:hypothetical protein
MAAFDDVDLDRSEGWTAPPPSRHRPGVVLAIVVLAVAGGVLIWWFTRERAVPAPAEVAVPAPVRDAAPLAVAAPRTTTLPGLDDLDPALRELVRALAVSPLVERWLEGTNLARQIAALVHGAAGPSTPMRLLSPMRPNGSFEVVSRGGRSVIAPESHARYDALAAVVTSIDARAFAEAYRTLSPRLEEAHRELGTGGSFDASFRQVLTGLIDLRVPDGPLAVVPHGGVYAFADPALEDLPPVEKLLLRSGPDNARRIQQRLREFRDALDQPTSAAP